MTQLLQTKLQRPRIPRNLVLRSRLLERLDEGSEGPLTLVCAGAGYGKTTLVSSWIHNLARSGQAGQEVLVAGSPVPMRRPVAWISVDERDSDLGVFLHYLVAGLQTAFHDACPATSGLLRATRRPSVRQLSTTLINEIAALPQDFVLVIDDYQRIAGTAMAELFGEFERHWPQPLHLVLISRIAPPLSLSRWRGLGQMTEIRAHDLRFTPDEAATYLEQALQRPLAEPSIEMLEHRTEGWISGIQLAGMLLRDAEDPDSLVASLSGQHVAFAEYLADEILAQQPPEIMSFLLHTAVLDPFSEALCEVVLPAEDGAWDAQRCIDWIEQHSLFVTSFSSRGEWYGYHQMFRDLLLERAVRELGADRVSDLHCTAAGWFASQGLVHDAVRHALAAGDRELAADFVAQGLRDALNREDRATLERWLGLFPDEFIRRRPDLLIVQAWSLFLSWQLRPLAQVLSRASSLLRGESGPISARIETGVLRGNLAALSAVPAYLANDHAAAAAHSREAEALLPEAWSYARGGGLLLKVLAMQAGGQCEGGVRFLTDNYASLGDRTSVYALRHLQGLCMINYRQAGDLEQIAVTGQRLADEAKRGKFSILQSWGHYLVGIAHYQRNELSVAEQSFVQLLDLKYTGNLGALRDGVQRLAVIHLARGDEAKAWSTFRHLSQLDVEQMGHETDETRALRARLWLMGGKLDLAARWADDFDAPVPDEAWPWQDPPHLTKARILLARGTAADVPDALGIVAALREVAERTFNVRLQIEVLALQALTLGAAGEAERGREALMKAVDLAWPGGFVNAFVNLGVPMFEALNRLAKDNITARSWVRRVLAQFGRPASESGPENNEAKRAAGSLPSYVILSRDSALQPLVEPLSPRELEMLMHMQDPLPLKEIARQLFISPQTAKRHAVNIYGKLGVNSRWDAVAKAQSIGLLQPR